MFDYSTYFSERLQQLHDSGSYRYFLEVNKSAQHFPKFYYQQSDGTQRSAVNWCSNDYLCMSTQEEVIAKLGFVTHRSGTGSSGTRNISGTTVHHRELEELLAAWHRKESALLFNGAYQANVTSLQTLGRLLPQLVFISDERNHASLIEGMRAAGNPGIFSATTICSICSRYCNSYRQISHASSFLNPCIRSQVLLRRYISCCLWQNNTAHSLM